jgi:FixJ family two-component response regulator
VTIGVPRVNVLLVDDDESLRRALQRAIRLGGFTVEAYPSVDALFAHGLPGRGSCLVLDVDLPAISGIDLKRSLVEAHLDLPTIFITALEPSKVNDVLIAFEPVAVLYKPFDKAALMDALRRASG